MVAIDRVSLLELLRKAGMDGDVDFLRESVEMLAQAVIELEVGERIGAEKHERTADRSTYRNGYRERLWDTRVGRVNLRIPKLREGSFFPELLQPRRRSERALLAVVQEAYVHGVSTRKMDELVKALGLEGISKSEVSRICQSRTGGARALRGEAGHQRCPRRLEAGHWGNSGRRGLATMPSALHAKPVGPGAEGCSAYGLGGREDDLHPARSGCSSCPAPSGRECSGEAVS
jgi:hypothetical protein